MRSADNPDSLRGPGLDGLVIDEAAFLSVDAWQNALRPALADRQGWAMLQSTPNGRNWYHKTFISAKTRKLWQRWQLHTSDNPIITDEELEDIKVEIGPRRYAQEIEAQFTEVAGAMWPAEYFGDHIWADEWPDAFGLSAMAVDPSMGATEMADYSAIVFVGLVGGNLFVDADIKWRPPLQLVEDSVRMWQRYRPTAFGVECNGFQAVLCPLFDLYCQQHNLPPLPIHTITNTENKKVRIQRLDPHLANRKVRFHPDNPDCKILVEQLMMFPSKHYHDDGPDALEMAIRLLNHLAGHGEPQEEMAVA